MHEAEPVQVVGCGSAHGDDSLGWEIIRRLKEDSRLAPGVMLRAIEGSHQLLDLLGGCGTLLLLDAVQSGGEPGTIYRFIRPDVRIHTLRPNGTHDMRPAQALQLAEAMGSLPPRVIVFGIEAGRWDVASPISPDVTASIPELINQIVAELSGVRS